MNTRAKSVAGSAAAPTRDSAMPRLGKSVSDPLEDLGGLNRQQLIARWNTLVGDDPPPRLSIQLMRYVLAFEMQAKRHGRLSPSLRRRIAASLDDACRPDRGMPAMRLKPGARLIREWNGVAHKVDVTKQGYVWNGATHRSLSAIARAITGARWSGPRFFGLTAAKGRAR